VAEWSKLITEELGKAVAGNHAPPIALAPGLFGYRSQNPCDGMRSTRLKRGDADDRERLLPLPVDPAGQPNHRAAL
jgi:hypothetical protein